MNKLFLVAVLAFILCAIGIVWYTLRKFRERERAEAARAAEFLAATAGRNKLVEALPPAAAPAAVAGKNRLIEALPDAPVAAPTLPPAPAGSGLAQQKMLFEAAHKAGEAGEPALSIQLYARLLARFPESAFAVQARAAAESQKKKIAKG